jgi:transcriptional regulator with XRE-family HTH domain
MHLVGGLEGRTFASSYHNRPVLTRPDSLPYVFRKLRIHRNLTKRTLAEKFSVSERYVSDVENGSRFPSLHYCLKAGELYGANPGWVKSKWSQEAIRRFSSRLLRRLGLDR